MGFNSPWHWLIVLLVILLLFGAKKIPELAKGLGSGIRNFKKELDNNDEEDSKKQNIEKPKEEQKTEINHSESAKN